LSSWPVPEKDSLPPWSAKIAPIKEGYTDTVIDELLPRYFSMYLSFTRNEICNIFLKHGADSRVEFSANNKESSTLNSLKLTVIELTLSRWRVDLLSQLTHSAEKLHPDSGHE
jgi:hypothetical protein